MASSSSASSCCPRGARLGQISLSHAGSKNQDVRSIQIKGAVNLALRWFYARWRIGGISISSLGYWVDAIGRRKDWISRGTIHDPTKPQETIAIIKPSPHVATFTRCGWPETETQRGKQHCAKFRADTPQRLIKGIPTYRKRWVTKSVVQLNLPGVVPVMRLTTRSRFIETSTQSVKATEISTTAQVIHKSVSRPGNS